MSYTEQAKQIVLGSSVALYVLMGESNDVEFLQIRPKMATDAELLDLRARCEGRCLRGVGVIGLINNTPRYAFSEHLEPDQVNAMCNSFLAFLNVLYSGNLHAERAANEVMALRRMYEYSDSSPHIY